jgi:signal transduction histidine kinase
MPLTREQLQERLVALHRASLELVQDVSLETLLERIASLACEQACARYAAVGVLDKRGRLKQFITVGMTSEEIKQIPHPPQGKGLIGALMKGGGTIRIPEIGRDRRSAGFPAGHPKMRSLLGVSIQVAKERLGQIYLTDKIDAPEFTEEDEKVIETLAAYAGAAIQNARLYESLRKHDETLARRNEDLALLNHISSALASTLELDEILNKTLAQLISHFKAEAGEIFLREEDGQTLRLVLHRGQAAEAFWTHNRFKVGEGSIGRVAETMQPVVSRDLHHDKNFLREAVAQAGFEQVACIPLTARGELVGVFSLAARSRKPFDEDDIQLMVSVGAGAGTAIENARLHTNARRLAVLEERQRIGMDLHDGIIQSIYGVGMSLENARLLMREDTRQADDRIQKAIDDLNSTIRDIRTYILDLRPRDLRDDGLMEGLKRLTTEFQQNTKAEAFLSGPKSDHLGDLPQSHALALFHTCQEALANAAKHAQASRVTVDLWSSPDRVLLEIQDNGRGFEVADVNKMVGHGLANMLTRVHNVGGDLDVSSAPGEGTTILAWVPRSQAGRSG